MENDPEKLELYRGQDKVDAEFWETLAGLDPDKVSLRTGAFFRDGVYALEMLGWQYLVDVEKRFIDNDQDREVGFQEALVLLAYLGRQGPAGLSGERVTLLQLNGGAMFFTKQHTPATEHLAEELGLEPDGFLAAGKALGARQTTPGELSWLLMALPLIPMELFYFLGDDEFPPKLTLLTDSAALDYLTLDTIFALVNLLAWRITKTVPA